MNKKIFLSGIELKGEDDGKTGEFTAIFSTFNVVDLDGDVTLPGAFTDGQKVRISYWGHRWGEMPVGRGEIHADQEKAWVDGRFFLDTEAGRETYQTVKNLAELQEWSYGFDIIEASYGKFADREVRFLKKMDVFEVSPVMLGAGIGTQTTAIKSTDAAHDDLDRNESEIDPSLSPSPKEEGGTVEVDKLSMIVPDCLGLQILIELEDCDEL